MNPAKPRDSHWKLYFLTVFKSMLAIYIATFCLALFYLHRGEHWIVSGIMLGILYLFVFIFSIKKIIQTLPIAGLMIAAPTLPLILLLLVLSLLPILQWLQ